MSSETKFRQPLFAEKTGEFLYWHYWGWMNKGEFIGPLSMGHNVKDEMGQQHTGLNDKNGVPIYEDDIILYSGEWIDKVVFDEGSFWVSDEKALTFLDVNILALEVIGNIYENPELLENDHE